MTEENKMKIMFAPGVLEQLERDSTPEELQELLTTLQQKADSGELFEQSEPVNMTNLQQDDPEMFAEMMTAMKEQGFDDFEEWLDHLIEHPPTLN